MNWKTAAGLGRDIRKKIRARLPFTFLVLEQTDRPTPETALKFGELLLGNP